MGDRGRLDGWTLMHLKNMDADAPQKHALNFVDGLKDEWYATFRKEPNIHLEFFLLFYL